MAKRIVLPADVYDTLELSALAYGGIGGGMWYDYLPSGRSTPHCVIGHAWDAVGYGEDSPAEALTYLTHLAPEVHFASR